MQEKITNFFCVDNFIIQDYFDTIPMIPRNN